MTAADVKETLAERETALLARFSPAQVAQARRCVAAGGVSPAPYPHEWHVTSSSGRDRYLTTVDACECHAGQYSTLCWHRAAVILTYLAMDVDDASRLLDTCPEMCWAFRHFDYCEHTEPAMTA